MTDNRGMRMDGQWYVGRNNTYPHFSPLFHRFLVRGAGGVRAHTFLTISARKIRTLFYKLCTSLLRDILVHTRKIFAVMSLTIGVNGSVADPDTIFNSSNVSKCPDLKLRVSGEVS